MAKKIKPGQKWAIIGVIVVIVIFAVKVIYSAGVHESTQSRNIHFNKDRALRIEHRMEQRFNKVDNALVRIEKEVRK